MPSQPRRSLPGEVLHFAKRRHFRGLAAKSLVSGEEFGRSASTSGRFGNPPADGCTRPCARHGGKFAAASTSNGRGGRLDVFNSSCLSHICGQRAVPCEMAGGGHSRPFGSSTMPRPASRTVAFEPEHIQAMQGAFDTVCARLKLSTGTGDRVTELVARRIIELGRAGERDANRLAARTLAEFGVENDGSLWRH
jgi:hypothetical protein